MVFLDTNVILEIILKGRPKLAQVKQFLSGIDEPTAISMLSTHLIMHFGRKEHIRGVFLEGVIGANELLALIPEDYLWAVKNESGADFEDALQMATAIRNSCTTFVTLDASLAKAYAGLPIKIITP